MCVMKEQKEVLFLRIILDFAFLFISDNGKVAMAANSAVFPSKLLSKKPNVLSMKKYIYRQLGIWMPPPDRKEMNMCAFDLTL